MMSKARSDAVRPAARQAATPIAFVQAVVRGFERYGANPADALQRAQIAPSLLRRPEARVTAAQFELLCGTAMQQLDDEALGWFSRRLPWGSYGLLCRASLSAPNLGVALKRWCRHHRLFTDDIVLSLDDDGQVATLAIEEHRDLGSLREFCLLTSLRYVHGYACWAVDSRIALRDTAFPFAAPPHAAVYPLLFSGEMHFDAPRAGFSFDAHYLELPLRRDERALRAMLQHALPLTVLQYRRDRLLVQRVRELLHDPAADALHAEGLARALNVSLRTLHRHLQQEGASVQALKDEVRCGRAQDLLRRTRQPVKQIAHQIGYRSEKSFARAFRQWTGAAPSDWRAGGPVTPSDMISPAISGRIGIRPGGQGVPDDA
ncbi:MAG: transcriptional regulator, AraC family [Proteobacteria bacterium]|nr:transcriptional regulator, AraC family [Pseudomonadota bacterium]